MTSDNYEAPYETIFSSLKLKKLANFQNINNKKSTLPYIVILIRSSINSNKVINSLET